MKIIEMKNILFEKLQDENCYFTSQDIVINKTSSNLYTICINGCQPFKFELSTTREEDEYITVVTMFYNNCQEDIIYYDFSKKDYNIKYALVELGYYIGTRF